MNDVMENKRAAMLVSWTPYLLVHIIGQVLAVNTEDTFQCSCVSSPAGYDIIICKSVFEIHICTSLTNLASGPQRFVNMASLRYRAVARRLIQIEIFLKIASTFKVNLRLFL